MKIAIIGYGKMGKEIEQVALERGHSISCTFSSTSKFSQESAIDADVAIEFTKPELALSHIGHCLEKNIPVVVGTTGWGQHLEEIQERVKESNGSLLYASNFSLGVHLFFELSKKLSSVMKNYGQYSASITETHHTEKLDKPSGTAISTAEALLKEQEHYTKWELTDNGDVDAHSIPIYSERIPNVPGTHQIDYASEIDEISLIHKAKNRKGFATGAVLAAEWLADKKGIYTMSDIINFA